MSVAQISTNNSAMNNYKGCNISNETFAWMDILMKILTKLCRFPRSLKKYPSF